MKANFDLVSLCMEAACESRDSVDKWRRQKRSLERLPSPLADDLLRRLHTRRLLYPSLLEIFKHSAEEIDVRGENSVDAEWMAYLGAFRHLRSLNVADCHRINSSALWAITGMNSLQELDLSRCVKVNDAGIKHILSIENLEKLHIAETGVTAEGVKLLASLKSLSVLDLGGLPVNDMSLNSLQVLKKLQYLDLWGSKISNEGSAILSMFPKLSHLNLAWTSVTRLPNLLSLEWLNMSNCTIDSILKDSKAPLAKLVLSGATFLNEADALLDLNANFLSFVDVSYSCLCSFYFLSKMKVIEHLNLNSCMMGDDSVEMVACIGRNLKSLNLSGTRVSSAGVGILAGHVPKLEILSLSQTPIDDAAISYISLMPSLKFVDLSNTNIKGFIHQEGTQQEASPLSLTALQNLTQLERLNLEQTQVRDEALYPLSTFQELRYIYLKSTSLADISLYYLSSIPKLISLNICDAVLTNYGLDTFKPPATLRMMDLTGCWLLTKDAISSFCRIHPQIEVRHEFSTKAPIDQSGPNRSSLSRLTTRSVQGTKNKGITSLSPSFIDQRLKYTRDALLALQPMPSHLASDHEKDNAVFE
ncbi:putative adenylate cyclase regulatory protein isoform X1 [Senna tora]|uniref:Putative adenylate cyclase regulatory protein isoform X1 n=1 Tax=Senna tora TaxID=362788 RepID=A0A834TVD6_9FABA|nr:putative adenylate cyclase regulatory protein isoform X1 [Senna tora]